MKRTVQRRSGFTLIELLVVVAIIALLISILLPSLSAAREQAKKARCLANLSQIGKAMVIYSLDDRAEQLIPIHMNMVRTCPYWQWRTINWFAWGGRSGQKVFRYSPDVGYMLAEESTSPGAQALPEYAANRRPLNLTMFNDLGIGAERDLEVFHCPSDKGYPDDSRIDDAPRANAERPCYDTLGNSYRANLGGITLGEEGSGPSRGAFATGPWGHRASTLLDTSRLVLAGEPTWFNMIGRDRPGAPPDDEVPVRGWHRQRMRDNLLFCDGSARDTVAEKRLELDAGSRTEMGIEESHARLLFRGSNYRLDVYPIGGARIWGAWSEWRSVLDSSLWPGRGAQDNLITH